MLLGVCAFVNFWNRRVAVSEEKPLPGLRSVFLALSITGVVFRGGDDGRGYRNICKAPWGWRFGNWSKLLINILYIYICVCRCVCPWPRSKIDPIPRISCFTISLYRIKITSSNATKRLGTPIHQHYNWEHSITPAWPCQYHNNSLAMPEAIDQKHAAAERTWRQASKTRIPPYLLEPIRMRFQSTVGVGAFWLALKSFFFPQFSFLRL